MTSTRRRRLAFAAAYAGLLALTFVVQRHVRPSVRAAGLEDLGVLDWAPSFLVAFATPFLFAALDPRLGRFGTWCLGMLAGQLLFEYEQQFSSPNRYDPRDLAAVAAGFALSYALHRWIARGRRLSPAADRVPGLRSAASGAGSIVRGDRTAPSGVASSRSAG